MSSTLVERATPLVGVSAWPTYPTLYEINTWIWLSELSQKYGRKVDLASVPSAEWDDLGAYGFDAVWFMGVWQRSAAGIAIAHQTSGLLKDFRHALTDIRAEDNVGPAVAI